MTGIHGFAVAAVVVCHVALAVKLALLLLLSVSLVHGVQTHALRLRRRVAMSLLLRQDGELEVEYRDGSRVTARIDASTTALHWLSVLCLRHAQRHVRLPLLRDAMEGDDYRQLQIWLRQLAASAKKN